MRHRDASTVRALCMLIACASALGATSVTRALASGGWGPKALTISRAHVGLFPSSILSDDAGGAFIVWHGTRSHAQGTWAVYAQRLTAAGEVAPGWDPDGVLVSGADSTIYTGDARVVRDGAGGLIVTWGSTPYPVRYRAQRINPAGARQWGADGVPISALVSEQGAARVIADGAGGVVIAWLDDRPLTPGALCPVCHHPPKVYHVLAQRLAPDGRRVWGDGVVVNPIEAKTNGLELRQVRGVGTQVIWSDAAESMKSNLIDLDGAAVGDPNGLPVIWRFGRSVNSEDGGTLTALGVGVEDHHDVVVRKSDSEGQPVWPEPGVVVCDRQYDQVPTGLMSDDAGGAIVVWQDKRILAQGYDVFAQRVLADGVIAWGWQGLKIEGGPGDQKNPAIIPDGSGGAILAWDDDQSDVHDVYARRILGSGAAAPGWPAGRVHIGSAGNGPATVYMVADGKGGAIVMWQVREGGSLYAQHVNDAGHVGDDVTPTLASLIDIVADQGIVRARWYVLDAGSEAYDVERSHEGVTWTMVGRATAEGQTMSFVDRGLAPGRYGYRLKGVGGEVVADAAWIDVPMAARLRFAGFRPNPASRATEVEFELPAVGAVVLDVFDTHGRRVARRDLGLRGAGVHRVAIGDVRDFGVGVFWLRLTHPACFGPS